MGPSDRRPGTQPGSLIAQPPTSANFASYLPGSTHRPFVPGKETALDTSAEGLTAKTQWSKDFLGGLISCSNHPL